MNLSNIAQLVVRFVNQAVVVIIGLSIAVIIFGVIKMIAQADQSEGRQNGQKRIIWGIVGVAIALSTWGLVNLVVNTF